MTETFPRIVDQSARYTYYEVAKGVFNTFPLATGGYASLAALQRLKNDEAPIMGRGWF